MRPALLLLSLWLVSCGGPPRGLVAAPSHSTADDPAAALARRLPGGARECVVARPTLLDGARRRQARWVSRAYPFAWLAALDVRAYASASQIAPYDPDLPPNLDAEPEGARSDVVLMDVGADPATVRALLRAQPWLRATFDGDPPCVDADCARSVAQATVTVDADGHGSFVRLRRGTWRAARRSAIDGHCADLVHNDAGLLEASAVLEPAGAVADPRSELREVRVARDGLGVTVRIRLPDVLAGLTFLHGPQPTHDGAARIVGQAMEGTTLVRRAEATWDDLALAEGDEERLDRALAAEASLAAPRPVAEVNAADATVVLAQASARRSALASTSGDERRAGARELVALLTAGHAASPDDVAIATALVRTLLDELGDGAAAARIASEMRQRVPDERAFALLERESLAVAGDVPALAAALARDGLVPIVRAPRSVADHLARRIAADVVAAHRDGVAYAWAEGGACAAAMLDATRPRATSPTTHPATLPLAGVPAALLGLLRLGAEDRWSPRAAYFRVTGDVGAPPHVAVGDAVPVSALLLHDDAGRPSLLFAGRSDDGAVTLARIGRDLAAAATGPALAVSVSLVPFDRAGAPQPEVTLVVEGSVIDGGLRVDRVSPGAAGLDWDVVARFLAAPLAAVPPRVRPAAVVPLEARDVAEAERLAARAEPDVSCARDEAHLSCRAVAGSSDDLVRTLTDMVGELLGDAPRALFERLPATSRAVQRPR